MLMKYLIIPIMCVFIAYSIHQQPQAVEEIPQKVEVTIAPALESVVHAESAQKTSSQIAKPAEVVSVSSDKQILMEGVGILATDFKYVDYIISHESSWRHKAVNSTSGATGLCQSLPANKMASAGADYLTNPTTQMKWCNEYAIARYGSWYNAYIFWQNNRWW